MDLLSFSVWQFLGIPSVVASTKFMLYQRMPQQNNEHVYESRKYKQVPYPGSRAGVKIVQGASYNKSPKASFHSIPRT